MEEQYKSELTCRYCKLPYSKERFPVQFRCGLVCCELCVEMNKHCSKKTKICYLHEKLCFQRYSGLKSIDAGHLIEQMAIVKDIVEMVASRKPQQNPRLVLEWEDLQSSKIILQNLNEKAHEELKKSVKEERLMKEKNVAIKRTVSKFESSLREEWRNEVDEKKKIEKEIQFALEELNRANEEWREQVEKSKAEAAQRAKERQKQTAEQKLKKKTKQVTVSSKWLDILNEHNTDTTEGDDTVTNLPTVSEPVQNHKFNHRNPFDMLGQDDSA